MSRHNCGYGKGPRTGHIKTSINKKSKDLWHIWFIYLSFDFTASLASLAREFSRPLLPLSPSASLADFTTERGKRGRGERQFHDLSQWNQWERPRVREAEMWERPISTKLASLIPRPLSPLSPLSPDWLREVTWISEPVWDSILLNSRASYVIDYWLLIGWLISKRGERGRFCKRGRKIWKFLTFDSNSTSDWIIRCAKKTVASFILNHVSPHSLLKTQFRYNCRKYICDNT